jgi:hypothetical protein
LGRSCAPCIQRALTDHYIHPRPRLARHVDIDKPITNITKLRPARLPGPTRVRVEVAEPGKCGVKMGGG